MSMPIISVPITDPAQWQQLRKPNVGCSEVAALFGIHEFITGYALAARKLGKLDDTVDSAVLKRGRLLEPVARQLLQEQEQEWEQIAAGSYWYDPDLRFGATPDLFVRNERGIGVVQIKTVAPQVFAGKWHNDAGVIEPPLWVALQAMCEQYLTGADCAYVAALVIGYGLSLEVVPVPYLPSVIDSVRSKVAAFWQMVDRGELPDPNYGADRANLAQVLRQDDGTEIDLRQDNEISGIVAQLTAARHAKKLAEDQIDHCQAAILHKIGAAVRAIFSGGVITAKTVNRKEYVAKASVYRPIRIKSDREMEEAA
jgi:hypothetical protein